MKDSSISPQKKYGNIIYEFVKLIDREILISFRIYLYMNSISIATLTLNPSIDHIITVGRLHSYSKNIIQETGIYYGGKGINTAYALGKLGANVKAIAFTGADDCEGSNRKLRSIGADFEPVKINKRTRNTYKVIEADSGRDTEFNEQGFDITKNELKDIHKLIANSYASIKWLLLCGSLPPGVPENFYKEIIQESHNHQARVCLDTSGSALQTAIEAKPDILRINRSELEEIKGQKLLSDSEIFHAMDQLIKSGIKMIAVSLGADGAAGTDGTNHWRIRQPPVDVVSTTGAGDAMTAGLIYSLSDKKPFNEALKFATAVAAASTRKKEPGDFSYEVLHRILNEIWVQKNK